MLALFGILWIVWGLVGVLMFIFGPIPTPKSELHSIFLTVAYGPAVWGIIAGCTLKDYFGI